MPLDYPPFDRTEYACLAQNLNCVDVIKELNALDKEIKECSEKLEHAKTVRDSAGKGLMNKIKEHAKEFEATNEQLAKDQIKLYGQILRRDPNPMRQKELNRVAHNIYTQFAKLDQKGLEDFFKAAFADDYAASTERTKEVQSYRARLTNAKAKREAVLKNAIDTVFRDGTCPETFKSYRLGDSTTKEQLTEIILTSFERDWRARAPLFEVPVTVNGVNINSLDPVRKVTWWNAYVKLGLDKLTRKPVFSYLVAPKEVEIWAGPRVLRGDS